jgi:quinol monooxygenase YgiN
MARDVTVALLVRFEARPGKEEEVVGLLRDALSLVQQEPDTVRWFGLRFGPTSFGIFDAFPDAAGRQAHLDGKVARALQSSVGTVIEQPTFEEVDVLVELPPE